MNTPIKGAAFWALAARDMTDGSDIDMPVEFLPDIRLRIANGI